MDDVQGRRIFLPLSDRCKDGRLYQVNNRARNGIIYLRCHNSTFCFGTAKFENNQISHTRPHSEDCFPDETSASIEAFKKSLKDSLTTHWYKLRDLFDQTALLYPEAAALVTFQGLKSYMMRCRRMVYPARPTDLEAFSKQLNAPRNERMLEYATGRLTTRLLVDADGNRHIILYDAEFIRMEIAIDVTKLFIDATFRSTPHLDDAYQLLTIMGIKFNHGIPIVWVIMSRKLQVSYVCVFEFIRANILPEARVDLIMSDFEAAIRNASNLVFPNAHCAGCNTHYDRAILQKLKSLGLQTLIREDESATLLTKKLLALAYLPSEMIQPRYFRIKDNLPANLKRRFNAFFGYYERYWLRTVSPSGYSVFGLSRRTNNILESNSKLGHNLGAHPSPWDFINKLLILQNHAKCDVQRLQRRTGGINRHARYQTVYKNNELQKAWKELYYRQITVDEFIVKATHLKCNITHQLLRDSNGREGSDFEILATPGHLPLANDPDYDAQLFHGVFPGPFMRDNAQQEPEQRVHENDNDPIILERPLTPVEQVQPEDELDEAALIQERPPTPQEQVEPQDVLVAPVLERPATPQGHDRLLDGAANIPVRPQMPEREPDRHEQADVLEAAAPDRQLRPAQEAQAVAAAGSRHARRRQKQRQRRRNHIPGDVQIPDAVRPRRASRKRRRTDGEALGRMCTVCLVNPVTHALLPCGHMNFCEGCSRRLYLDDDLRTCPTCRTALERSPVRVYI